MTVNDLTLLTMYAVSAADGKAGGGTKKVIPKLTGLTLEEVEQKALDFDSIVAEISKLPKEAVEAILAVAQFVMHADGIVDPNEEAVVSKIEKLLTN